MVARAILLAALLAPGLLPSGAAEPVQDWVLSLAAPPTGPQLDAIARGATVEGVLAIVPAVVVSAPESELARLSRLPFVTRVDLDEPLELHLDRSRVLVRADEVASVGGGVGTPVAIVDTGVDALHPALSGVVQSAVQVVGGNVVPGSVDEDGHGTHVASIVAGTGEGSPDQRYRGVAAGTRLIAVDITAQFTVSGAVRAYEYVLDTRAETGVRVVVSSFGRTHGTETFDADDPLVRATNELADAGILVVFSAGNRGPGPDSMPNEALNPRALTVGAVDAAGREASFTSRPPAGIEKPDVWAPGVDILAVRAPTSTELPDLVQETRNRAVGLYTSRTGTSMAAPHAAALAAMLLAREPDLAPDEVISRVRTSSVPTPDDEQVRMVDAAYLIAPPPSADAGAAATVRFSDARGVRSTTGLPVVGGVVASTVRIELPVSVWAERANATITWDSGSFQVVVRDPNGAPVAGPFTSSPATVELPLAAAGLWKVEASTMPTNALATLSAQLDSSEVRTASGDEALAPARFIPSDEDGAPGPGVALLALALALALALRRSKPRV